MRSPSRDTVLKRALRLSRAARDLESVAFQSDAITTPEYRAILAAQTAVRRALTPLIREYR